MSWNPATLDMNEIWTGLWIGAVPTPLTAVKQNGFDVLVLCADEFQFTQKKWTNKLKDVEVLRVPLVDRNGMDETEMRLVAATAKTVAEAVRGNRRALVTCAAGLNRSGLVTGITLHLLTNWHGMKVINHVRAKRMFALNNDFFANMVLGNNQDFVDILFP